MPENKREIFKPNEIIRGNPLNLSLDAKKLMNSVIYLISKNKLKNKCFSIQMSWFRKAMQLENNNNYVDIIAASLESLATPIILKNYTDIRQTFYKGKSIALIGNNFSYGKKATHGNKDKWMIDFRVNDEFYYSIKNAIKGNFTCLKWREISNKFSSKYTIGLYEYLKSWIGSKRYITITVKQLHEIFGKTEKLPLSKIEIIVKRCVKEIKKKSDITYLEIEKDKGTKEITFYFIPKKLIKTKKQKNKIKKEVDSLAKRMIK